MENSKCISLYFKQKNRQLHFKEEVDAIAEELLPLGEITHGTHGSVGCVHHQTRQSFSWAESCCLTKEHIKIIFKNQRLFGNKHIFPCSYSSVHLYCGGALILYLRLLRLQRPVSAHCPCTLHEFCNRCQRWSSSLGVGAIMVGEKFA